jgi:hypothetical protein
VKFQDNEIVRVSLLNAQINVGETKVILLHALCASQTSDGV